MKILSFIGVCVFITAGLGISIAILTICVSAVTYLLQPFEGYILQGLVWTAGITLPSAVIFCIGIISYGINKR